MTFIASLKKERRKTQDLHLIQLLISCVKTVLAASAKAHYILDLFGDYGPNV